MIDTCNSSFSEGASHPTTESIIVALDDLGYKTDINLSKRILGIFKSKKKILAI